MDESPAVAFVSELEAHSKLESLQRDIDIRLTQRHELSNKESLNAIRKLHQDNKKSLKSDVKKASMFVNKLRSMNSEAITQCIRDVETLNLTLYISEIVNAILEISFKPADVPSIVVLSIALHKRYEDFSPELLEKLKTSMISSFSSTTTTSNSDDSQIQKKRRIQIRLLIELYEAAVFLEEDFFVHLLRLLVGKPIKNQSEGKNRRQVDLMGITTFVKYGGESLLGLPSKSTKSLARSTGKDLNDVPIFFITNPSLAQELKRLVSDVFNDICNELVKAHKDYKKKEKKAETDKLIHGSLTEQKQIEWENAKKLFERLFGVVSTISESIGEDVPVLEEDKDEDDRSSDPNAPKGISVWDGGNIAATENNGPFGDADSRSFYEDLPDILSMVPLSLLGLTPEQATSLQEQWKIAREARYHGPPPAVVSNNPSGPSDGTETANASTENNIDEGSIDEKSASQDDLMDTDKDDTTIAADSEDTPYINKVMILIQDKLPECTNKIKCDEFCQSFMYLNSKSSRKKLANALCKIPWGRGELVSSYARIIASLHRIFNDIAPIVLNYLQKDVTFILKNKALLSANQIDSKCRTLRYLGELIKFNVAPPINALKPFKAFLTDFTSHNVDYMAALLESCGRYLYLLPYTHDRMENILETMMRLRRSKYMDLRQQTLVDSAYFAVKPPERINQVKKELTTVQRYIRYLFLDRLSSKTVNVDGLIASVRRLPFTKPEEEVYNYIIKFSLRVARQKYGSIGVLADLLAGIQKYHPNLIIRIVDTLHEELFRGFDVPFKCDHQRMIGYVRLLGEFYNYAIISSSAVFYLLYLFIHYGHSKENQLSDGTVNTSISGYGYTSPIYNQMVSSAINSGDIALSGATSMSTGNASSISNIDSFIEILSNVRHDPSRYDPKIVSDIDPSNDCFRCQLVVELINSCGEYFVKGQAKEKLNRFLVYFQRYLMSKLSVPLHIEFSILDMFDTLESNAKSTITITKSNELEFPIYNNLDTIQSIIDSFEVKSRGLYGSTADEEEDDEDSGDEDESSPVRRSQDSDAHPMSDDGSSEDQRDDDNTDDEEDNSISEIELAKLMEKKRLAQEEDEEFEKAFRSVVVESLSTASKNTGFKSNEVDRMAIPAFLPRPKNILRPLATSHQSSTTQGSGNTQSQGNGVVFKMLSRDNKGRLETRQLLVPQDNSIVQKLQKSEEAVRLEKQRIKEKVLQLESMHSENEEADEVLDAEYGLPGVNVPYVASVPPTTVSGKSGRGGRAGNNNSGSNASAIASSTSGPMLRGEQYARRGDEFKGKKVTETLNLDEFLAESAASEIRRMQNNLSKNK